MVAPSWLEREIERPHQPAPPVRPRPRRRRREECGRFGVWQRQFGLEAASGFAL